MSSSIERPSAAIYHFPLQPRMRRAGENGNAAFAATARPSSDAAAIVSGSWYHEEAVRDAERAKKR